MYTRIVVGADGTDRSLLAVDHAARLARQTGAELHLVAVAQSPSERSRRSGVRAGISELSSSRTSAKVGHDACLRHGVEPVTHRVVGEPAAAIIAVCDDLDADLVVIGANGGAGGQRHFDGSLAGRVLHHTRRPVLVVHTG